MFRYFAFVWNSGSGAECDSAVRLRSRLLQLSRQWESAFDAPGLSVFCADPQLRSLRCRPLPENTGVIAGSLFDRPGDPLQDTACEHARFDVITVKKMSASQGRSLIEDYWGNYVAFLHSVDGVTVIVSPSGRLPCLSSAIDGITCVFSCLTDALALGMPPPCRSHIYMCRTVLGLPPDSGNPLNEVTRLLRGEALHFRLTTHPKQIQRRCLWGPRTFVDPSHRIDSPNEAASTMRAVVRCCTQTLTRDYDHVKLRLSGGLDSSIIAGCLRGVPAHVACHTYATLGTCADPRPWARLAALHSGFDLTEHAIDPSLQALPQLARLRASVEVVSRLEYLSRTQLERELCQSHASAAVFTGDGGDAGFCSDCSALAATQHLKHNGLTFHAWSLSRQVALDLQRTHWHVLRQSLKRWRGELPWIDYEHRDPQQLQLASPSLVRNVHAPTHHPWLHSDDESSLAFHRLGQLVQPIEEHDLSIDSSDFAPEIIHPLCAQPVVELLLRIPIYRHFEAGRDRGLARRAFSRDASPPNLERTWKDRAPGFLSQLVLRHTEWLRETLLDGVLVTERYLDRAKVEAALSPMPSSSTVNPAEILRHLDIELWARRWNKS